MANLIWLFEFDILFNIIGINDSISENFLLDSIIWGNIIKPVYLYIILLFVNNDLDNSFIMFFSSSSINLFVISNIKFIIS